MVGSKPGRAAERGRRITAEILLAVLAILAVPISFYWGWCWGIWHVRNNLISDHNRDLMNMVDTQDKDRV